MSVLEISLPRYCMDGRCGPTLALSPLTENEWNQIKALDFGMFIRADRDTSFFCKCLKCKREYYFISDLTNPQHSFCVGLPR